MTESSPGDTGHANTGFARVGGAFLRHPVTVGCASVIGALVILLTGAVLGVFVGLPVSKWLLEIPDVLGRPVQLTAAALGTVTFLGLIGSTIQATEAAIRQFDGLDIHRALSDFTKVFLAALTFTVSLQLIKDIAARPQPHPSLSVQSTVVILGREKIENVPNTLLLPYFWGEVKGCDAKAVKASAGAKPSDKESAPVFDRIKNALRVCREAGARPTLDVRGFASSREFQCGDRDVRNLNWELAEERRTSVLVRLGAKLSDGTWHAEDFEVEPSGDRRWSSGEEMASERFVNDRTLQARDTPVEDLEPLTRLVEIKVKDPGGCGQSLRQ